MLKAQIYTIKGTKTGELTLPSNVFGVKPNMNLLAQAVHVYEDNAHPGLRKAKTRSEVNRTTKKLYRQKGTGGARHGSRRAPIFVGGGVALGPRPVRRVLALSDRLKSKSRAMAFSYKLAQKEVIAVSGLSKVEKTKEAASLLAKLSKDLGVKRFTFVLSEKIGGVYRFLRNLGNAETIFFKDANAFNVFGGGLVILDEEIFETKKEERRAKKEKIKTAVKKRRK